MEISVQLESESFAKEYILGMIIKLEAIAYGDQLYAD
jgi:hypothetical protein